MVISKYKLFILAFILTFGSYRSFSQVRTTKHTDGGIILPLVFSFIDFTNNPSNLSNVPRFSCFFHLGQYYDLNIGNNLGFFSGLTLLNVGFTALNNETDVEKRFRSYALGVPVALKLGSFKDNFYLYGGAEYQWLFHYKEKTFINGEKIKYTEWFSNKTVRFMPSVFVGIQFPKNWTIKFQYMLEPFLRPENITNPYFAQFGTIPNGNVFWISLSKTNFLKFLKDKALPSRNTTLYSMNQSSNYKE